MPLTWPQVLSWRQRRHLLDRATPAPPVEVARRLVGLQAQVMSSAEQAVAVRTPAPAPDALAARLAAGELVRTWAMRGTLHVLPVAEAVDVLALLAAGGSWERGAWQKTFLTAGQVEAVAGAATSALAAGPLAREELAQAIVAATGDADLGEHLRSGWGAVLKPLAWQGLPCQAGSASGKVTFAVPTCTSRPGRACPMRRTPARASSSATWVPTGRPTRRRSTPGCCGGRRRRSCCAGGSTTSCPAGGPRAWRWRANICTRGRRTPRPWRAPAPPTPSASCPRSIPGSSGRGRPILTCSTPRAAPTSAAPPAGSRPSSSWAAASPGTWEARDGAVGVTVFAEAPPVDEDALGADAAHLHPGLPVEVTRR